VTVAIKKKKRKKRSSQEREVFSRRSHFAHTQRVALRTKSANTLIRLEKLALLGRVKWMSIPDKPDGWHGFIERLAKSRGASRLAEWWRNWILTIDPKTCPVDDKHYGTLLIGLGIASWGASLLENPSRTHQLLAYRNQQREAVKRVRVYLQEAQKASECMTRHVPVVKKGHSHLQNPIQHAISEALRVLDFHDELFGYTKPRGAEVGRRGRAAADPQAATRGYAVRGLAEHTALAPTAIREAFIAAVLECAGQGTRATRQNVQAILRANRGL
jgi:hypothetical protein